MQTFPGTDPFLPRAYNEHSQVSRAQANDPMAGLMGVSFIFFA